MLIRSTKCSYLNLPDKCLRQPLAYSLALSTSADLIFAVTLGPNRACINPVFQFFRATDCCVGNGPVKIPSGQPESDGQRDKCTPHGKARRGQQEDSFWPLPASTHPYGDCSAYRPSHSFSNCPHPRGSVPVHDHGIIRMTEIACRSRGKDTHLAEKVSCC